MLVFGQSGCIRVKWLISGKSGCNRGKVVVFGQEWLYLDKVVGSRHSNCVQVKWLYSGKSGCIRENWLYSVKKWLYLCKSCCIWTRLILFWKNGCIGANRAVIEKISCIPAKWLYSGNLVVFGQSGSIRAKMVVFGQ